MRYVPITFGFNASTNGAFFSLDTVEFTGTDLLYEETPSNGEQALRDITFTAAPGYFDTFTVLSDSFNNGGIIASVSADGSTLTLNWTGGLVAENVTNTYAVSFAGTPPTQTPLPGTLPLFASGLGALGLLGWRRKRKAQAAAEQTKHQRGDLGGAFNGQRRRRWRWRWR